MELKDFIPSEFMPMLPFVSVFPSAFIICWASVEYLMTVSKA